MDRLGSLIGWSGIVGIATGVCGAIFGNIGLAIGGAGGAIIAALCDSTFSLSAVILSLAPKQGLAILMMLLNWGYISRFIYDELRSRIAIEERYQQN